METLVHAMAHAKPSGDKEELNTLRKKLYHQGEVSWEVLADFWTESGKGYEATWNN